MRHNDWVVALGLGAVTGLRTMLAAALLARRLCGGRTASNERTLVMRPFRSRAFAGAWTAAAALELLADKSPRIPARVTPLPLAGRLLTGALVGLVSARTAGRERGGFGAVLGAIGAVAAAFGAYRVRRAATAAGVPNVAAGLAEDALALLWGRLLVARVPETLGASTPAR